MKFYKRWVGRKLLALLLLLSMVLGQVPLPQAGVARAGEQPVLVITGTGLGEDVLLYAEDLAFTNPNMAERYFSSNKNTPEFHKIWKVKGFDLFTLLGSAGLIGGTDWTITFKASDGFTQAWTISQLQSMYYHPDFTAASAQQVLPMIGIYRTELFSKLITEFTPPVSWSDRDLTAGDRDSNPPRLFIGQAQGEISDRNQSRFVRDLTRIVVGEERPPADPPPGEIDFTNSPYKHITYAGAPYNVDALTGATMTVEGPGVTSYRALSLRQIEETNAGLHRGTYTEKIGGQLLQNSYEGMKVSYILDNFVTLRSNVGEVIFKDKGRKVIARYTLAQIRDESKKMIVAYGVNEAPLVYTNLDAGYIPAKYNDDGCFKLVFHGNPGDPPTFSNVAYIYVEEDQRPGYEHSNNPPYDNPKFTQYIFTLSGSGLGKELNYTVAELEAMTDLHLEKEYCLSNSYYFWYYNTYKGVPLWDLLVQKAGLDPNIDESTPVRFIAADHYNIPPLTVGEIKNHHLWGYYEKDALDKGDGTFDGSGVEPLDTGYPVLVAYGYNGYPYVNHAGDPGYNSGLGNDGGPLRIIFGKRDYNHTNGSHQVKYALRVVVGEDLPYTTHSYPPYDALANESLTVTVKGEDGNTIKQETFTVGEIEQMIYGAGVPVATADRARVKGYFYTHNAGGGGTKISDLYEGVGLSYLLFEKIGLPGTMGTVTFTSSVAGQGPLVVSLEEITRADYFNEVTGVTWLRPVLAFAKNGYPMVKTSSDSGYIGNPVVNRHGPLLALFGQTQGGTPGQWLRTIDTITVNISKDPYAHLDPPYDQYASHTLSISGSGVRKAHSVTVGELEFMQNYIFSGEYCLARSDTEKESATYRGIDIYEFLRREVGFTAGADTVTFKAADGFSRTFTLEEIARRDYINELTGANNLRVMLAYGKNEKPLIPTDSSEGYDAAAGNDGGPLRLVIGQTATGDLNSAKAVSSVVEIIVNAAAGASWKHDYGIYTQYLDLPVLRVSGSQVREPRTFSLRQLEALDPHIVRDLYMGESEVEGIILWKVIKDVVGLADGVTVPSSIRVFAGPNYNQLQNTAQVMNGVVNSQGLTKDIILGYAINGYPLVPHASSPGYVNNNEYGPLRLIVEENISMWTKWVDCVVVGAGSYEQPRAEDIIDDPVGPVVFTVSGDGVSGGSKVYTQAQLQALGESAGNYSYTVGGQFITDQATGVLLADVLADAGVTNPAWEINVTTTDGFNPGKFTLQEAIEQAYLLSYLVNGQPFEDAKAGHASSTIRIYRNFNTGTNWRNRLTLITGVDVTSTGPALAPAPQLDWSFYRNNDGSGLPWANVLRTTPDGAGGFWAGTNGGGAAHRHGSGQWTVYKKANSPLPHDMVNDIAVDGAGGVWFATGSSQSPGGIAYKLGNAWTVYTTQNSGLPSDYILAITRDDKGGIWFGTGAGPVYRDASGNWILYEHEDLPGKATTVITLDGAGGAWFGFHPLGQAAEIPGGYAHLDAAGNLTPYKFYGDGRWARSICFDKEGGLWICRFGKVDYIAPDGQRSVYESDKDLLPFLADTDRISYIEADSLGGLWLATMQGGLFYRGEDGAFSVYNSANTFPAPGFNYVWRLKASADGKLFVSTNGGVAVATLFEPAGKNNNADLRGITTAQGMLHPAFSPGLTEYTLVLPSAHGDEVPAVGAEVADTGKATLVVTPAANLAALTVITVKAEDGTTVKVYKVKFEKRTAVSLPAPGTAESPATINITGSAGSEHFELPSVPAADVEKYNVNIVIPEHLAAPTLSVNVTAEGDKKVSYLPAISINAARNIGGALKDVEVKFPAGAKVSGPADWDGTIILPTIKESPGAAVAGTVGTVIELGFPGMDLTFDKAVRLLLPGQAGKAAGYIKGGVFTEIARVLVQDNQSYADSTLPAGGDGKIDAGDDLAIWTKHFTEFVTYSPAAGGGPGGGTGGGTGGGPGGGPAPSVPSGPALLITGSGLKEDVQISNWSAYSSALVDRYYSSNNNWNFHKIWKVRGFDLFSLFGTGNLKTDQDYTVTFVAADGLRYSESISSLKDRYYYPHFTGSGSQVYPVIGFYRAALFEPNVPGLPVSVTWSDRSLTAGDLDDMAPRLYLGQKGNPSDRNQPLFVRELVRIVVGEERPNPALPLQVPAGAKEVQPDAAEFSRREVAVVNGRAIEKLVLNEKVIPLLEQLEGLGLVIKGEETSDELQIVVAGNILQVAWDKKVTFILETGMGRYYLPGNILPLANAAAGLGVEPQGLSLTVSLGAITKEKEAGLAAALGSGQRLLAKPLEFSVIFAANGKTVHLTSFSGTYVKREIKVSDGFSSAAAATGVSWNAGDKGFRFAPTRFITREGSTYAAIFSRYNSVYTVVETKKSFDDLKGHWARGDIELMAAKLLLAGRSEKLFDPNGDVTRAETAALLTRGLALLEGKEKLPFRDVTGKEWFAGPLAAALEEKLISGYPDGSFLPGRGISREEMAVLLTRAYRVIKANQAPLGVDDINAALGKFSDNSAIGNWARGDVALAVRLGIIQGFPQGTFLPRERVSRAQAAVMIMRLLQNIEFID